MANSSSSSTSRSTCLESASNSSSSTSRSSAVSLLSVLKAPTVSDLSRYTYMYRYCIYGHCYSLCKQIKLLMSKILSIIGKKKKNCWKEKWEKKQNRLVPSLQFTARNAVLRDGVQMFAACRLVKQLVSVNSCLFSI